MFGRIRDIASIAIFSVSYTMKMEVFHDRARKKEEEDHACRAGEAQASVVRSSLAGETREDRPGESQSRRQEDLRRFHESRRCPVDAEKVVSAFGGGSAVWGPRFFNSCLTFGADLLK